MADRYAQPAIRHEGGLARTNEIMSHLQCTPLRKSLPAADSSWWQRKMVGPCILALAGRSSRRSPRQPFPTSKPEAKRVALAKFGRPFIQKDLLILTSMLDSTSTVTCEEAGRELGWHASRSACDCRADALRSLRGA